ncbi:MAG TPA: DUF1287 domain-containing protein [Lacibacter sp.]|nr:DUF1287 domain-containing protein [Lacibacter sp.]HMO90076.1 DUF1287 domain-containing protein [Lacibacter sp.]HMP85737.1 DUF1287 domain-containing protein [Lacibacter sp.]
MWNPISRGISAVNSSMKKFLLLLFVLPLLLPVVAQPGRAARLSQAALELTRQQVVYDPAYYRIAYPNGDVPAGRGVCTDVVIRAYRRLGVDLQVEVYRDRLAAFHLYPRYAGQTQPDRNIDHRRVPNLMVFFSRNGTVLPNSTRASDYRPGDIVCWNLGGAVTHIGLVVDKKSAEGERPLIVHNIGAGQVLEDCLFRYRVIGHYRYQ